MDEVVKKYIEDIIKPLEDRIKKLYIKKYKYKILWTKSNEQELLNLEKKLFNYLIDLEKFIL